MERYYRENPLAYLENLLFNLLSLSRVSALYDWRSSEGRLRLKILYYETYKWFYLVGVLIAVYYLVRAAHLKRILSLYALSILAGYLIWGILEARYVDTIGPHFLVILTMGATGLLEKGLLTGKESDDGIGLGP